MFPRLGHVLNPQFALVAHERELQTVLVGPRELVDARSFAASWLNSPSSLQCHLIAGDGPCAPCVTMAFVLEIDIEGPVGLNHPDSAK